MRISGFIPSQLPKLVITGNWSSVINCNQDKVCYYACRSVFIHSRFPSPCSGCRQRLKTKCSDSGGGENILTRIKILDGRDSSRQGRGRLGTHDLTNLPRDTLSMLRVYQYLCPRYLGMQYTNYSRQTAHV